MRKTDARVRYTQQALKTALLKQLETKPINKVSVKEVCESAELNRATFYAHYTDCYDLLEQIENDLLRDYTNALGYLQSFDVTQLVAGIYDMIERNSELCRVLIFKNANAALLHKMIALAHDRSIAYWRGSLKKASEAELEMLFVCLANGLVSVVVEGYAKYDKKTLVAFVSRMANNSVAMYL